MKPAIPNAKIFASNNLDERTIMDLQRQCKIDVWGIGTKLITSYDQPTLGAVYKMVSLEDDHGQMVDTIKLPIMPPRCRRLASTRFGESLIEAAKKARAIM